MYSQPGQTSKIELFAKIIIQLLTIFTKKFNLRCSTGFWIRLYLLQTSFGFWWDCWRMDSLIALHKKFTVEAMSIYIKIYAKGNAHSFLKTTFGGKIFRNIETKWVNVLWNWIYLAGLQLQRTVPVSEMFLWLVLFWVILSKLV